MDAGIDFTSEVFFKSVLLLIYKHKLQSLSSKSWIDVKPEKGRIMMGTVDETHTLEYGQVYVAYSDFDTYNLTILERTIICAKNPCFHPGDLRRFQAVDVPALHHMKDCIVFPQKGPRPHPDEMSGSDLDGDMYFVCWDDELIPDKENQEPMEFSKCAEEKLPQPIEITDVTEFIGKYIQNDQLGVIANAHVVHADTKSIFCPTCIGLAQKHSDAVDFPKTGQIVRMEKGHRPESYPDFMAKRDKPRYVSQRILGKLYRQCQTLGTQVNSESSNCRIIISDLIDLEMEYPGYENFMETAEIARDIYNEKVKKLMNLYGIESEAEIVTGLVLSLKQRRGYLRNDRFDVGEIVKAKMSIIRQNLRYDFFEEFGGKDNAFNEDGIKPLLFAKASAWYIAGYSTDEESQKPLLSFPWVVSELLCDIKKINSITPDLASAMPKSVSLYVGQSLKRYIEQTNQKRGFIFTTLERTGEYVIERMVGFMLQARLSVTRKDFTMGELLSIGITPMDSKVIYIHVINTHIKNDTDLYDIVKKVFAKDVRNFNGSSFKWFLNDGTSVFISFKRSPIETQALTYIREYLRARKYAYFIFVFLVDWANIMELVGFRRPFANNVLLGIMIIFALKHDSQPNASINIDKASDLYKVSEKLLFVLKQLNSVFIPGKKIPIHSETLKNLNFEMTEVNCNLFKKKVMHLYTQIAMYSTVDLFYKASIQQNGSHLVMNMPMEIWGSMMFAEVYTARKLQQTTGAEISIRRTTFRGVPGLYLEVFGTLDQIKAVQENVLDMQERSSNFVSSLSRNITHVKGAYRCVFPGATSENDELILERYRGQCNVAHQEQKLYVPNLISNVEHEYPQTFLKQAFKEQLGKANHDYNPKIHGEIKIAISFGSCYFFNNDLMKMTIANMDRELNKREIEISNLACPAVYNPRDRRRRGRIPLPRGMNRSFMPISIDPAKMRKLM